MRTNFNVTCLFHGLQDVRLENYTHNYSECNDTDHIYKPGTTFYVPYESILINALMIAICIAGLVGNGNVIRLLGFYIKRNPFTTYILNLAVADFGVLMALPLIGLDTIFPFLIGNMYTPNHLYIFIYTWILHELFLFTYCTGQLLLTAISLDRCVSVLFPIWHRCRRPPHLSTTLCALIWVLSFLLCGIHLTLIITIGWGNKPLIFPLIINALLCLPLITVSSLTLFIKICFKSQQQRRGKLLTAILLALLFFLIFAFPLTAIYFIYNFLDNTLSYNLNVDFFHIGFLCASLNSSVNPLIYFLVGRRKRGQSRESMKVILQRVFREEEESGEQLELRVQTQL